jgi:molybdate transport system substrate-binding protein
MLQRDFNRGALRMKPWWAGLLVLCLAGPAIPVSPDASGDSGTVAVAGSLFPCVSDLAERYAASGGNPPRLVVGSSGKLARQIEAGAPFGLFLSANVEWLEYLKHRGLVGPAEPLASSPLVLWWSRSAPPDPALLAGEPRVAIADPEAAPFGAAARLYLEERGMYDRLRRANRLIITGTVLQSALAVQSGGADLALTALSVARKLKGGYTVLPVPALRHAGAPVQGKMTPPLEDFWRYLRSPEVEAVWREWGFEVLYNDEVRDRSGAAGAAATSGGSP